MAVGRLKKDRVTTSGNTAARPSNPEIGDTHYNGQLGQLEIYNGTSWIAASAPPLAPTLATPTNASGSDAYSSTGGKLSVVFTRNADGGEPIQYNAYTTSGGFSASSSTSTVTITGLTPGTAYTVYGNVQNNFGTSTNSANTSAVTPSTKPQAPTIGTANAGVSSATLTFTAGNSGGSSITNYKYSIDGTTYTAFSPAQTTSPLTISGLTNGTSYAFYLKAVNANGDSTASAQSNSVTPAANFDVEYLVIAGGGSGGTYTPGSGYIKGNKGTDSIFSTVTSEGGGYGGRFASSPDSPGGAGGSGGGAGANTASVPGGTATANQGSDGGTGSNDNHRSGGGGGAGQTGRNWNVDSGKGGDGLASSITGSSVTRAGGGGRGSAGVSVGAGGAGGGGAGGLGADGTAGTANTGGGGGGADSGMGASAGGGGAGGYRTSYGSGNISGGNSSVEADITVTPGTNYAVTVGAGGASVGVGTGSSGTGGSGVVILRYPTSAGTVTIGAGLTGTTATDGSDKVTTITAGSGNVSW